VHHNRLPQVNHFHKRLTLPDQNQLPPEVTQLPLIRVHQSRKHHIRVAHTATNPAIKRQEPAQAHLAVVAQIHQVQQRLPVYFRTLRASSEVIVQQLLEQLLHPDVLLGPGSVLQVARYQGVVSLVAPLYFDEGLGGMVYYLDD